MNGQADEFCLVEPLASTEVIDLLQKPGSSQGSNGIVFGEKLRLPFFYRLFCIILLFFSPSKTIPLLLLYSAAAAVLICSSIS